MKSWNQVTIVGVGLLGGSIGLALLERRLARVVVGVGRRNSSLAKARQRGAVTTVTTELATGVADAELIVICTPVASIVEQALTAAERCSEGALITDVGSTKASITTEMDRCLNQTPHRRATFVGSHPMAGSEKTGPEYARADLFEQRTVVITPSTHTPATACDAIDEFWRSIGGITLRSSPSEHDQAVASISHLPHLVAAALAASTDPSELAFAGSGWLDTTRVAAGDVELWRQILRDNQRQVLESLSRFENQLVAWRQALESNDDEQLVALLEAGKRNRDAVGN